jgi:hypothetical protein
LTKPANSANRVRCRGYVPNVAKPLIDRPQVGGSTR